MKQYVYFITEAPHKVKIGIAKNPEGRLGNLRTGNPDRLTLHGYIPGGEKLETELRHRFAAEHIQLEWHYLTFRIWLYALLHRVVITPLPIGFWLVWPVMRWMRWVNDEPQPSREDIVVGAEVGGARLFVSFAFLAAMLIIIAAQFWR